MTAAMTLVEGNGYRRTFDAEDLLWFTDGRGTYAVIPGQAWQAHRFYVRDGHTAVCEKPAVGPLHCACGRRDMHCPAGWS
jgi:hypothetical protein